MSDELDPDVALLYELMRRGSVLPSTMEQIINRVHDGITPLSPFYLEEAERLTIKLWGIDSLA